MLKPAAQEIPMAGYTSIPVDNGVPIQAWTNAVPVEAEAQKQLANVAGLPFVFHHIAAMPDVHWGMGATVGSVIATHKAVIPAAVGVDIGCGMMAVRTTLRAHQLPDDLHPIRTAIEQAVPHGRTDNGGEGDRGSWHDVPERCATAWGALDEAFKRILEDQPKLATAKTAEHLGTLGSGNHFIELCLDEAGAVWAMLHSGSRGIGNKIGTLYVELAKRDMERFFITLPDADLAYFPMGTDHYAQYMRAVSWAQQFARLNRQLMMDAVLLALGQFFPALAIDEIAVNCHHNYVNTERHFGETVLVTRKGAVRAQKGDLGIIPGSMGAKSFIVRGKGNPDSFCSCSHGAGRAMSRHQAKTRFTLEDHAKATEGIECRKDAGVLDETPGAYKDIDAVMAAQADLVEIVHTLKQVICVKG
jgi:tRNA-splicing ligase RtcB (3'-phosphate/5'-hydroxy nucleic acid ligase)